jgi:hypothetical protein
VRELQHLLLAWELLGEPAPRGICRGHPLRGLLPGAHADGGAAGPAGAERLLDARTGPSWTPPSAAHRDPLTTDGARDPIWDRLFTRIVLKAPAPIGVGKRA